MADIEADFFPRPQRDAPHSKPSGSSLKSPQQRTAYSLPLVGWDNREDAERGASFASLEAERAADRRFPCLGNEQKVTLLGNAAWRSPNRRPSLRSNGGSNCWPRRSNTSASSSSDEIGWILTGTVDSLVWVGRRPSE